MSGLYIKHYGVGVRRVTRGYELICERQVRGQWVEFWRTNEISNDYAYTETESKCRDMVFQHYLAYVPRGHFQCRFTRIEDAAPIVRETVAEAYKDAILTGTGWTPTPTLDALENTTERMFTPLDWPPKPTPFDPFKGFFNPPALSGDDE